MEKIKVNVIPFQCAIGPCGRSGVYIKFVLILKSLKFVCVARNENIHIQLPLKQRQACHVTPWDHLVSVDQTDFKLPHCHHLLLWVIQVLSFRNEKCGWLKKCINNNEK